MNEFTPVINHATTEDISIGYDVLEANKKLANNNRTTLEKYGVTAYNIMGAIGSGKTLLIEKTITAGG